MTTYVRQVISKIGLSPDGTVALAQRARVQSFAADTPVWRSGAVISDWCYVISGLVAESTLIPDAGQSPLHVYGPRSWFGEQAMFLPKPTIFEFRCLSACELLMVPIAPAKELLGREASAQLFVSELIAWRAQRKTQVLALMKMGNPLLRVVIGLVLLAEALTYASARPPTITTELAMDIPIGQRHLSSLFGVSRTLVSEFIKKFEREGWLSVKYGAIEVRDLDAWRKMASTRLSGGMSLNPTPEDIFSELRSGSSFLSLR